MKRGSFYIRHKMDFNLVKGYIDTVKDVHGNKFIIGFHHANIGSKSIWGAVHIASGLVICSGATRKECFEKAKSEKTLDFLNQTVTTKHVETMINEMNQFLQTGDIA